MPPDAASSTPLVAERGTAAPERTPAAPAPTRRRRRRRPLEIGGALLAALAVAGAGGLVWRLRHPPQPTYQTARLDVGPVSRAVTASGTVNPVLTVIVGSYVSGVIQEIRCDYNTPVRRGQVCATIDPRPYAMAVDQARAALGTARAQLVKDQATLGYAEANAARFARLLTEDSAARDTAENSRAVRDAQRAQVAVDRASIAQHEAALSAAEINLGYTQITSPVDGVVVSRNVTQGQTVAASFQTPTLFLIAQDLTKMQVDTNVSESDIGGEGLGIYEGAPASFTVEAYPGRPFQGRVAQIRQAPQTVQNVVTYDVVIATPNADLRLKPGMTATARIFTARREHVLRAPNAALRYRPGGRSAPSAEPGAAPSRSDRLWLVRNGRPTPVAIRAGLADDSFTEIAGGRVTAGDAVVIGETRPHKAGAAAPVPRL